MTGNEFIDQLRSGADFMKPEDLDSLVSFYENRLLKAKSADEEEKIVADFGSIELILRKLKIEYGKLKNNPKSSSETESETKKQEEIAADLIKDEPANDSESEQTPDADESEEDDDDVRIFGEDDHTEKDRKKRPVRGIGSKKNGGNVSRRKYYGLANTIIDKLNIPDENRKPVSIALRIVFSPVFVILTVLLVLLYVAALAVIVAAAAVLGIIEAALILVSVAELVYGIVMFLTSVPVALIEIGLGTMLIGVVTAITALVYQLLTGVIPLAMKSITKLYLWTFRFLREFIFGSDAGGEKK
ncbi:MAG: hypothetical protein IJV00_08980 [Clostridia bacterium]|nr:hypothetical protein [Clostridia bacterium]